MLVAICNAELEAVTICIIRTFVLYFNMYKCLFIYLALLVNKSKPY